MKLPFPARANDAAERRFSDGARRPLAFVLALLAEAGLVMVVLMLGWAQSKQERREAALVSVTIKSENDSEKSRPRQAAKPATAPLATPQATRQPAPQPQPDTPKPPVPLATPPAIIPLSSSQMAAFDIARLPRQTQPASPAKGLMGPVDHGIPGDSKRVGTAPNGQPMYAASWYREPYDEELRGYLSLAQGPGWALITCKTEPNFRVDQCVGLDEYPTGSNIQRAVLAAAWQFKVRPPQVGGLSRVGDWVRIRIDYSDRRK